MRIHPFFGHPDQIEAEKFPKHQTRVALLNRKELRRVKAPGLVTMSPQKNHKGKKRELLEGTKESNTFTDEYTNDLPDLFQNAKKIKLCQWPDLK